MFKTFVAASCALSLVACIKTDTDTTDIDRALPTADQVSIKLPQTATRSLGQLANWYVTTRDVTRMLNGGSAWVLVLIHAIVKTPPTSVHDNILTWGPGSDALSPADYKLDVTVNGDGTFAYTLSGRSKTQANAQFEAVIDGSADSRPGEGKGSGTFLVDFDAGRRVNPIDAGDAKGSVDVNYDLAKGHLDLLVMSTDALNQPVVVDYAYNAAADGGGDMTFGVSGNAGGGPLLETITLRSRWLGTGAGRADARIAGGDLGGLQATASECWNTMFARVFYTDSVNLAGTEGVQTACAYATADLPVAR